MSSSTRAYFLLFLESQCSHWTLFFPFFHEQRFNFLIGVHTCNQIYELFSPAWVPAYAFDTYAPRTQNTFLFFAVTKNKEGRTLN